jgi:hypothetical protein
MPRIVFAAAGDTLVFDHSELTARSDEIRDRFGLEASAQSLCAGNDAVLAVLRGRIGDGSGWLTITGGSLATSPRSSAIAKRIVEELKLEGCERTLVDLPGDRWRVALPDMEGCIPSTLYHGTSDACLPDIRVQGLQLNKKANWELGPEGSAHGNQPVISLAAEANVAAMHAVETAEKVGGEPVVIEVCRPANLLPDHDVIRLMRPLDAKDPEVVLATIEAGVFATPDPVPPAALIGARTPIARRGWSEWKAVG